MIRIFQKNDSLWRTEYSDDRSDYKLNGSVLDSKKYDEYLSKYCTPNKCPFCDSGLEQRDTDGPNWFSPPVSICLECGYWALGGHFTSSGSASGWNSYLYWCAKLEEYTECDDSIPICELRNYISKYPNVVREISPKNLERLVADVFKASGIFSDVTHIGKPCDGGVDVVLVKNDSETILVQVKQRIKGKTESVSTVRNLLGAMYRDGCLNGIVVSTADSFSWHAIHEAKGYVPNFGISYKIDLIDEGKLSEMISKYSYAQEPWSSGLGMLHID